MASPYAKGWSTSSKRARSQDSPTPLASPPVPKATKVEEDTSQGDSKTPAFLRQSQAAIRTKFNDLVWKEKLRIAQGRNDPSSQWVQEVGPLITKRNRYANVQPWEKSRIHLKVAEGKSDYINASPIVLRDIRTGIDTNYIATQGPKQSGLSHFWQMVWQETTDVAVIIMLTQTHDGPMEKCFQYFPLSDEAGSYPLEAIDKSRNTPEGSVTFAETISEPDSKTEIRRLSLRFGDQTKDVWHFLFSGWPDFTVPEDEDRAALLNLLRLSAEKNSAPSNPRIIHCSAGVGRSGTFIALDHLLAQVESGAIADTQDSTDVVYNVVNTLREQRMLMVQMEAQYQFLYDVVKDEYQKKQHALASDSHSPKLRRLASGMEATLIGEADEKAISHSETTDGSQIDIAGGTYSSNGHAGDKVEKAGHDSDPP